MSQLWRYAWVLAVGPLGLAAVLAGIFSLAVRPNIPAPVWLLDILLVLFTGVGVLAGGMLGSFVLAVTESRGGARTAFTFCGTSAACVVIILLTGTPMNLMALVAAAFTAVLVTPWLLSRA